MSTQRVATDEVVPPAVTSEGQALRAGVLGGFEVLGQSVAEIAPSAVIGTGVALVAGVSGDAGWVTWLIGGVVLSLTAYLFARLADRFTATGGLYSLATRAAGPSFGYFIACFALVTYLGVIVAVVFQFAEFVNAYVALPSFGLPDTTLSSLIIGLIGIAVAASFAYRNVQLSARVMLTGESISIVLILILVIVVLVSHHGPVFNAQETGFRHFTLNKILLGMPLVMFSFGGFETATVLGREARNPRRAIPVALIGSVTVATIFFVVCSYVFVLGFQGTHHSLAQTDNILATSADISGISWYAYIVDLGVILSIFSVIVAAFNVSSRLLMTLSQERFLPRSLGRIHPRNQTPSGAILFLAAGCCGAMVIVAATRSNVLNAYGYVGSFAGYGQTLMYLLSVLAVLVFVLRGWQRSSSRQTSAVIVAIIAIVSLGYLLYKSFVPMPTAPTSSYVYVFFGVVAASIVAYAWLRTRRREDLRRVGALGEDLEPVHPVAPEER